MKNQAFLINSIISLMLVIGLGIFYFILSAPSLHEKIKEWRGKEVTEEEIITALKGQDINAIDSETSFTPLHQAALALLPNMVEALLKAGANPSALVTKFNGMDGQQNDTAIHLAARGLLYIEPADAMQNSTAFQQITALLAAHNPELVVAKNIEKQTPLHLLCLFGAKKQVEFLISTYKNVDMYALDSYGQSVFHLVVRNEPYLQNDIFGAVEDQKLATLNYLISLLKETDQPEVLSKASKFYGQTPLHIASLHYPKLARVLLNRGADPSIKDSEGQSVKEYAQSAPIKSRASLIQLICSATGEELPPLTFEPAPPSIPKLSPQRKEITTPTMWGVATAALLAAFYWKRDWLKTQYHHLKQKFSSTH